MYSWYCVCMNKNINKSTLVKVTDVFFNKALGYKYREPCFVSSKPHIYLELTVRFQNQPHLKFDLSEIINLIYWGIS